jgi:hypothetical protein
MVTIWNPADEAQDYVFTLFFEGGHYLLPLHLEGRETREFNVSEILQNQIPDAEGNLIPPSVHQGTAKIMGSHAENEYILVAVDFGVYNVRKATCQNGCATCEGYTGYDVTVDGFAVAVNGTQQETATGTYETGTQYNLTAGSTWTSSNTSVYTVSAGLVKGLATGNATTTGTESLPVTMQACNEQDCEFSGFFQTVPGVVTPTVSFSTISSVAVGQTATTTATVSPSSNAFPISLSISSPAAIVSPTGTFTQTTPVVVKGVSVGTATITATVSNSDGNLTVGSTSFSVITPPPVPVNFDLTSAENAGTGVLGIFRFYAWTSSDGNLNDLSNCSMRENVTYPGSSNPYVPSSPPWAGGGGGSTYPNPSITAPSSATGGTSEDTNYVSNLSFVKPYVANSFTATQFIQYSCSGGSWTTIYTDTITRSVAQSGGNWVATVSASDTSVTSTYTLP